MINPNEVVPGNILKAEQVSNLVTITTDNHCKINIVVLTPEIIRIRYSADGFFDQDFSYAIDSKFVPSVESVELTEQKTQFTISTLALNIFIEKKGAQIIFTDKKGLIINRDEKGFHWEENKTFGGNFVKMSKTIQDGEHFYGMGDKTMHLNLRGRRVTNWAMDTYGFRKEEDPIYKSIPFYTSIHNNIAYGIFFDNTFKSFFDFGSERRTVASFWAEGGEMNYYFIYGPSAVDVTRRFNMLTGVPELPPIWALGYQQSKWSYYPEKKVKEITQKLRDLKIPCDAIYIDIDYMDGFRCFTWDYDKFPDPQKMVKELNEDGFKVVVIIDPGIKVDPEYSVYQEGIENNYFCRRADGPILKGNVWPGDCHFPDFTNPKVRKWWAGLYQNLMEEIGVNGVWNDMNEPALLETEGKTFPLDVRHDFDGNPCSHRKAHNVYGTQMARATFRGVKKFGQGKRPMVITRAAYPGAQRYASSWTGDNIASWEHLWIATMQVQRLNISGFSFVGTDVGGFIDQPTPELFVRWIQLATFQPFFRTHSSGDHGEQEPWSFGAEALQIVRKYIELRYQLLPYIYSTFYRYVTEYKPMILPIAWHDQEDNDTLYRVDEFLLGDHILVCPVLEPNVQTRYVYLPKGQWYHYWTGQFFEGGKEILAEAKLDEIPLYVRPGAVIPMWPVMQYIGEKRIDQMTLKVFYGQHEVESILYEDSGDGYEYEKGIYNKKTFKTLSSEKSMKVTLRYNGHFETEYSVYKFMIFGLPFAVQQVMINGKSIDTQPEFFQSNYIELIIDKNSFLSLELIG